MVTPGLTAADAARRLHATGPNEIRQVGRISRWASIGAQLRDPLVVVLLAACALTLLTGDLTDAAVIALVVAVNTTVGVAQELKADRAITALAQLTAPSVRVRRDGAEVDVPSAELVPDDVVLLGEGDVVPADCDLLEAVSLLVDEAALTGEAVAVAKAAPSAGRAGQSLSAGTVVVKGRAVAIVTGTGVASALGRIAELMDTRVQPTPLQRRLGELGRSLAVVAVALCAVVLVMGLARGQDLQLMVVTAISLAVAAVPESLPAVVTFSLALGARRMADRHAVIRRLPAVETLGSVTVLATDKTGTLTQAEMSVQELWTPAHQVVVSGAGYSPDGTLLVAGVSEGAELDATETPDVLRLLRAVVLCNDARLVAPVDGEGRWSGLGDPTEVALLAAAGKAGLTREGLGHTCPRVAEQPFDSAGQQMTTAHLTGVAGSQRLLVVTKGSVEALHARFGDAGPADDWDRALRRASELAAQGARVLAVTTAEIDPGADWHRADQRLLGLVAMDDPLKPAARATLAACRRAGILPVLITGDHPATALSVATRVGVVTEAESLLAGVVATGPQIAAGEIDDLTEVRVFARATPEQKLDIVEAWKARGAVVAMTGDGVNGPRAG